MCAADSTSTGLDSLALSCKLDNELSGFIKGT